MKKLLLILSLGISSLFSQNLHQQNYGDSLKGWNEIAIKAELLNHGVYGKEYFIYSQYLKREYINQKYGLNKNITYIPNNQNPKGKLLGGVSQINNAPCVNEDFEQNAVGSYAGVNNSLSVTGWTISSQVANTCSPSNIFNPGSTKAWIRQTPIIGIPILGNLPNSPLGGTKVIQLHDNLTPYSQVTKLSQTFPVTNANTLFQFAYAGVWQDGGHNCCEQPQFKVQMFDCLGAPLGCSSLSLNAQGSGCPNGSPGYTVSGGFSYASWITKYIDLTPYIGTCVTIDFINSDCIFGGHYGMVFIDSKCGGQLIGTGIPGPGVNVAGPVSFCAGSQQAIIAAPLGYLSYQWYGPNGLIAPPQGTMPNLIITNPSQGATYTVIMLAASGCSFTSINSLNFTQVNIAGTNTTATCPGGASGTATVVGNGSGTGYNYLWKNSTNSVVGTQSIVTNLTAGVYSITISGAGASGCGTAITTVTIPSQPTPLSILLKPYCGSQAIFQTNGGSNIQWYNNTTPVSTFSTYILNNPINGNTVNLSYLSNQGCQDSIQYILMTAIPGSINLLYNKLICPGGNNGEVIINLIPALGAPPGFSNYSVVSTGTTIPYFSGLNFSNLNTYTATGLQAGGTYSVNVFDGSCIYNMNFSVPQLIWNYTLSSNQYSFCPGDQSFAGVTFTSPPYVGQYSYSWTPTTWLSGNYGNYQNTIITPTLLPGTQSTIVYSVLVIPSSAYCPITKTLSITAYNPPIPIINQIPNLCNISSPYTIITSPQGGTFNTIPIIGGIIQPTLANIGINTFTYSINVYTCISTQTSTYEVSQFRTSSLTSTINPLCVTNSPVNLMSVVVNTLGGNWSGVGVNSNYFNPANLNTNNYIISYNTVSFPNPLTCPSSTTLNISVTNTITPLIYSVPEFCNIGNNINMTVTPSGGTWGGNGAISNVGVINPFLTTVPSSTVTYSIIIGPCLNTATTTIYTSKFNTAALTNTINNLCYNNPPINLLSIVQNTNGNWSGVGVINNQFSPSGLITNNYNLTYINNSTPNYTLCSDLKILTISVFNPPVPSIKKVGPFCSKDISTQMSVTPNMGYWVINSFINSNGLFTPSLALNGNNLITYIIGTNTCNSQQSINIFIENFISAKIIGNIPDQCNNNLGFNLSPISISNNGTWSGNGVIGNMYYPNVSGAGIYTLKYETKSTPNVLCKDEDTIHVRVYSLPSPIIDEIGPFCNLNVPIQLKVNPIGGIFGDAYNSISLNGLFNPYFAKIGSNIINYSITSGPCKSYAQTTIEIEKFISADFEKTLLPLCKNSYPINLNSLVKNVGGNWSGPGILGSMFDPSKSNIGSNVITYQTYPIPNSLLCPDTSAIRIEVKDFPKIETVLSNHFGCAPLGILFNTPNTNNGIGEWNFGDGSKNQIGLSTNYIYSKPGNYYINFSYNDGVCSVVNSKIDSVKVYQSPNANFYIPKEITISDPIIQVNNLTKPLINNLYEWKIGDNVVSNELNPIFKFEKIGNYKIILTAKSSFGCKDNIVGNIEVKDDFRVYIPNTFTPNGDGINDLFYPTITNVKKYNLYIFDRWGELIYFQENGQWDGKYKNELVKEGVYVWKIVIYKETGELIEQTGHTTLLR